MLGHVFHRRKLWRSCGLAKLCLEFQIPCRLAKNVRGGNHHLAASVSTEDNNTTSHSDFLHRHRLHESLINNRKQLGWHAGVLTKKDMKLAFYSAFHPPPQTHRNVGESWGRGRDWTGIISDLLITLIVRTPGSVK